MDRKSRELLCTVVFLLVLGFGTFTAIVISVESSKRRPQQSYVIRYELPGGAVRTVSVQDVTISDGFCRFVDPETGNQVTISTAASRIEIIAEHGTVAARP